MPRLPIGKISDLSIRSQRCPGPQTTPRLGEIFFSLGGWDLRNDEKSPFWRIKTGFAGNSGPNYQCKSPKCLSSWSYLMLKSPSGWADHRTHIPRSPKNKVATKLPSPTEKTPWIFRRDSNIEKYVHLVIEAVTFLNLRPWRSPTTFQRVTDHHPKRVTKNCEVDVSENSGTPKSSILIGFSIINYKPSIFGYPYFWKHPGMFMIMITHVFFKPGYSFNMRWCLIIEWLKFTKQYVICSVA